MNVGCLQERWLLGVDEGFDARRWCCKFLYAEKPGLVWELFHSSLGLDDLILLPLLVLITSSKPVICLLFVFNQVHKFIWRDNVFIAMASYKVKILGSPVDMGEGF